MWGGGNQLGEWRGAGSVQALSVPAQNGVRRRVLQVHPQDNVLVALSDLKKGDEVSVAGGTLVLVTDVPAKHKFSTTTLESGDPVEMYGVSIGKAVTSIRPGELITTGNVRHHAAAVEGKSASYEWTAPNVSRWQQRTFSGICRADCQVGTRNYWVVIPLVLCEIRNVAVLQPPSYAAVDTLLPTVY